MPEENRIAVLDTMWTFTHGYASLICVGLVKEINQEQIIKKLNEVGTVIVTTAIEAAAGQVRPRL